MIDTTFDADADVHVACEVVGVFAGAAALDEAVARLGAAGIDRAAIAVLDVAGPRCEAASDPAAAAASADDPATKQSDFVSQASLAEAGGAAIAVPLAIAGCGTAWLVAAEGGALLLAIGATAVAGVAAAGLGALLWHVVARRHHAAVAARIAAGGLILWVTARDAATQARAMAVQRDCGAAHVHTHVIERHWGVADSPLHGLQPDPFLEQDPGDSAAR
jgi:hypothetical protein